MKAKGERLYRTQDSVMLEWANTLYSLFIQNMADFTTFDATLNATYASLWLANIKAASSVVRDTQIKDIMAQYTNAVSYQIEICKEKYSDLKYFSGKAFPRNKAVQTQFFTGTKRALSLDVAKMLEFLAHTHTVCLEYQVPLQAAGMSNECIAQIPTLAHSLQNAYSAQQAYIVQRVVLSQERIGLLNTCFENTDLVKKAAKLVYRNNKAKWMQFA